MIAKQDKNLLVFLLIMFPFVLNAQMVSDSIKPRKIAFYELRGKNVIDLGTGTSVINGDFEDPKFEVYFHVGYKRYITPHLNVNFSYNKFNLAYVDVYNEGFMSFDLNLESTLMPHNKLSPFVFAGTGYNASNYFEQTAMKFQGGGGIELIVADGVGLKLYTDYNYVFSDELDGLIAGASDDIYFRIGFGVNYYFGGGNKKPKIKKDQPTMIKSNPIEQK